MVCAIAHPARMIASGLRFYQYSTQTRARWLRPIGRMTPADDREHPARRSEPSATEEHWSSFCHGRTLLLTSATEEHCPYFCHGRTLLLLLPRKNIALTSAMEEHCPYFCHGRTLLFLQHVQFLFHFGDVTEQRDIYGFRLPRRPRSSFDVDENPYAAAARFGSVVGPSIGHSPKPV